jgi:hypothetical protein
MDRFEWEAPSPPCDDEPFATTTTTRRVPVFVSIAQKLEKYEGCLTICHYW